ncbi:hypothetical protein NLX71_10135 [Paenibacillus sp. MZ04-78.2]|uniref:hypothetical protein n=1 Tax=Paenibacillus sp. MZ04-78.2 TaxID=2962034 RepID=UPI0020B8F16E|nr:hypothetical protein [Paenibacillus sp. MZ04-78.2]MCP3773668.1 hypothetical protein [Paenibacillus sp. MZ04-78.2]
MKEAVIVDLNGFMKDVTLVTDDVTGVFPLFKPHQITESTEELQQSSPEIIGYIIAIAVPAGLYKPKFDFNAWELYDKPRGPEMVDHGESMKDGNIVYKKLQEVKLWIEGKSEDEQDMMWDLSNQSLAEEKNNASSGEMKKKKWKLASIYKRLLNKQ